MIWLTQWKCPSNHTALAVAWDDADQDRDAAERGGEDVFTRGVLRRICGLCEGELHVEHQETVFRTIEEAKPVLLTLEAQNMLGKAMYAQARRARN